MVYRKGIPCGEGAGRTFGPAIGRARQRLVLDRRIRAVPVGERQDREDISLARHSSVCSFNGFARARVLAPKGGSGGGLLVPLLDPLCVGGCSAGVPFVTGIELHQGSPDWRAGRAVDEGCDAQEDVYELRFVLHGQGMLRHYLDAGKDTTVSTGDAILMRHGVARLDGLEVGDGDGKDEQGFCSMATFVVYMPRALVEPESMPREGLKDFASFGTRYLWAGMGKDMMGEDMMGESLSSLVDKGQFDSMLSGAALWMERNEEAMVASVDLTSSEDDFVVSEDLDLIESTEGTEDAETPSSLRGRADSRDVDVDDVYHKQLTASATYVLPNQTNRLALLFDPFADTPVPFVFGVEIFEAGHRTRPHVHPSAYEVFFILSGEGEGFCNGERFRVQSGDVVAFHPGSEHGIDNGPTGKMYCIEVMMPDEEFAEFVRGGTPDRLRRDELCILRRVGCK